MAIPIDGTTLSTANLYQLTAPGSVNAGATITATLGTLGALGSNLYVADPLATSNAVTFSSTTVNGVTSQNLTYADATSPTGTTTISGITLVSEGSSGFSFSAANGGTYFLSNQPIGGTQVNVNNSLPLVSGALDGAVGPNPTVFVNSTNTPASLDGQVYIACFLKGTAIRTTAGDRPIETLAIGDMVITESGDAKPVLWLGTRRYHRAFARNNVNILPIRVRQGAIGDDLPRRDLLLSPCHALMIDDVLIPAKCLVNGTSIVQALDFDVIEYFHIELEQHDVVLAEGLLAETFVDDASRMMFQNAEDYYALYPDREDVEPVYSAPRVEDGEILQAVRDRIASRVAHPVVQAA